ncbi:MAG: glycogen debranching protein GlgX [Anaerolineae bacterium]|nr:glycogen debranching protein GlgX [Anaerolineae bacterium]
MPAPSIPVQPGHPFPLGATVQRGGVNFSVYADGAQGVELLLFDAPDDALPERTIKLDSDVNKTFHYWHVFVPGLSAGQCYAYRTYGAYDPPSGKRYDGSKALLDPYARAVYYQEDVYDRGAACRFGHDTVATAMRSVVVDPDAYDWEGDEPLHHRFSNAVIYEMHVRGFTAHPNSGLPDDLRGTYAGLIEKIPYLQSLGVKAVELLPVHQFDPYATATPLPNYWGYQTVAFFAPHRPYSARRDVLGPVDEFRDMVKALHRADIKVILDVVYNHTAENGDNGPTLSMRGFANDTYYVLDPANRARFVNASGVGNTVNANNAVVRRLIIDSLRYWVEHMHVDGFRFDLASALARGEEGHPLSDPPVLLDIDTDPVLSRALIIAEPWDAAGLYQVSDFVGDRWAVWNGQYRDVVRRFVKGDSGMIRQLADQIVGAPSQFQQPDRDPIRSVNFVTAHDGFTLNDLVSYNHKHNEANGEKNRDGTNTNDSWNHGVEGPTSDAAINALRARQIRNFMAILTVSQGRAMLLMGDEVRRTQRGNNNAYNQDNEISWFDWALVEQNADLLRFTRRLIDLHQNAPTFRERRSWARDGDYIVNWHGLKLDQPDWSDDSREIALDLRRTDGNSRAFVIFNAFWEAQTFELPRVLKGSGWRRVLDTALPSPDDAPDEPVQLHGETSHYTAGARSVVLLQRFGVDQASE